MILINLQVLSNFWKFSLFFLDRYFESKKQEKDYNKPLKKLTLADRINEAKKLVLDKLAELKSINGKLRQEFVPAVVIANLTKTIKDIDVSWILLWYSNIEKK